MLQSKVNDVVFKNKRKILKKLDRVILIKSYRRDYYRYYTVDKSKIYKALKRVGIKHVRPANTSIWKLWYNTCYFSGVCNFEGINKKVFVKVNGTILEDCFKNELLVNKFIKEHSEYIFKRLPKILFYEVIDNLRIIVYEYIDLSEIYFSKIFTESVNNIIEEYTRIGLLHTDFGLTNMGLSNNTYYFFDYGTSLCPLSNRIRIRNNAPYNHLKNITQSALQLLPDATFYYDDITHFGYCENKINDRNYIVANSKIAYAKLGNKIIKYKLEEKHGDIAVKLLVICDD